MKLIHYSTQCCWIPTGTGLPVKYKPARPRKFETRNLTKTRAWMPWNGPMEQEGIVSFVYFRSLFAFILSTVILLLFLSNNHFITGPGQSSRSKSSTRYSTKIECRNVLSSRITSSKFAIRNVPDRNQIILPGMTKSKKPGMGIYGIRHIRTITLKQTKMKTSS